MEFDQRPLVNVNLQNAMLPEIRESKRDHELDPLPLQDQMKVSRRTNDYLPQRRIMRRKRSNLFAKTKDKTKLNVDATAENVIIPFASFVDHKMIK
eukprot:CAMPEP_0185599022 /NCGR_PEP_ID=MMETSP0434-20130131/82404_1 /TAXON_ID=626734 ORGANISM="Favella taraikaensis, Strain Fe Narragansett Bay" /NCGR_SAMPLE_ID=MMETSP0434 /ASSEMBLY_ACC=CAM_ASM_000379 /LENGTH=95 /DNA_ID=CAMNT_0028228237 /DNA_START=1103 /DNA_END=1390 /DNA_ORIENTATION=+